MDNQDIKEPYFSMLVRLPLVSYAFIMNYIEVLNEKCIDINHVHDCFELCICLENKLSVKADGYNHVLNPGDFILIMPGTPHNVVFEPDIKKKYLIMILDFLNDDEFNEKKRPLMAKINRLSQSVSFARGACPVGDIIAILIKIDEELRAKRDGWFLLFRGHCLEILFHCLREVGTPLSEEPTGTIKPNLAIEIKKYIQDNYDKKISLEDIANALHTSPRNAQRAFSDYFGVSCAKTINLYRMNYAKSYLTGTDLPINEIAERVGLSSAQLLNRLFRENEHMTANEYRAMKKVCSAHA